MATRNRRTSKSYHDEKRKHLKVLELTESPELTESEITRVYRQLALKCHPDKNHDDPKATEKFQTLTESYVFLKKAYSICPICAVVDCECSDSEDDSYSDDDDFIYDSEDEFYGSPHETYLDFCLHVFCRLFNSPVVYLARHLAEDPKFAKTRSPDVDFTQDELNKLHHNEEWSKPQSKRKLNKRQRQKKRQENQKGAPTKQPSKEDLIAEHKNDKKKVDESISKLKKNTAEPQQERKRHPSIHIGETYQMGGTRKDREDREEVLRQRERAAEKQEEKAALLREISLNSGENKRANKRKEQKQAIYNLHQQKKRREMEAKENLKSIESKRDAFTFLKIGNEEDDVGDRAERIHSGVGYQPLHRQKSLEEELVIPRKPSPVTTSMEVDPIPDPNPNITDATTTPPDPPSPDTISDDSDSTPSSSDPAPITRTNNLSGGGHKLRLPTPVEVTETTAEARQRELKNDSLQKYRRMEAERNAREQKEMRYVDTTAKRPQVIGGGVVGSKVLQAKDTQPCRTMADKRVPSNNPPNFRGPQNKPSNVPYNPGIKPSISPVEPVPFSSIMSNNNPWSKRKKTLDDLTPKTEMDEEAQLEMALMLSMKEAEKEEVEQATVFRQLERQNEARKSLNASPEAESPMGETLPSGAFQGGARARTDSLCLFDDTAASGKAPSQNSHTPGNGLESAIGAASGGRPKNTRRYTAADNLPQPWNQPVVNNRTEKRHDSGDKSSEFVLPKPVVVPKPVVSCSANTGAIPKISVRTKHDSESSKHSVSSIDASRSRHGSASSTNCENKRTQQDSRRNSGGDSVNQGKETYSKMITGLRTYEEPNEYPKFEREWAYDDELWDAPGEKREDVIPHREDLRPEIQPPPLRPRDFRTSRDRRAITPPPPSQRPCDIQRNAASSSSQPSRDIQRNAAPSSSQHSREERTTTAPPPSQRPRSQHSRDRVPPPPSQNPRDFRQSTTSHTSFLGTEYKRYPSPEKMKKVKDQCIKDRSSMDKNLVNEIRISVIGDNRKSRKDPEKPFVPQFAQDKATARSIDMAVQEIDNLKPKMPSVENLLSDESCQSLLSSEDFLRHKNVGKNKKNDKESETKPEQQPSSITDTEGPDVVEIWDDDDDVQPDVNTTKKDIRSILKTVGSKNKISEPTAEMSEKVNVQNELDTILGRDVSTKELSQAPNEKPSEQSLPMESRHRETAHLYLPTIVQSRPKPTVQLQLPSVPNHDCTSPTSTTSHIPSNTVPKHQVDRRPAMSTQYVPKIHQTERKHEPTPVIPTNTPSDQQIHYPSTQTEQQTTPPSSQRKLSRHTNNVPPMGNLSPPVETQQPNTPAQSTIPQQHITQQTNTPSENAMPQQIMSQQTIPQQTTQQQTMPQATMTQQPIPQQPMPQQTMPQQTMPQQVDNTIQQNPMPQQTNTPTEQTTPQHIPQQTAPAEQTIPPQHIPQTNTPAEHAMPQHMPQAHHPAQHPMPNPMNPMVAAYMQYMSNPYSMMMALQGMPNMHQLLQQNRFQNMKIYQMEQQQRALADQLQDAMNTAQTTATQPQTDHSQTQQGMEQAAYHQGAQQSSAFQAMQQGAYQQAMQQGFTQQGMQPSTQQTVPQQAVPQQSQPQQAQPQQQAVPPQQAQTVETVQQQATTQQDIGQQANQQTTAQGMPNVNQQNMQQAFTQQTTQFPTQQAMQQGTTQGIQQDAIQHIYSQATTTQQQQQQQQQQHQQQQPSMQQILNQMGMQHTATEAGIPQNAAQPDTLQGVNQQTMQQASNQQGVIPSIHDQQITYQQQQGLQQPVTQPNISPQTPLYSQDVANSQAQQQTIQQANLHAQNQQLLQQMTAPQTQHATMTQPSMQQAVNQDGAQANQTPSTIYMFTPGTQADGQISYNAAQITQNVSNVSASQQQNLPNTPISSTQDYRNNQNAIQNLLQQMNSSGQNIGQAVSSNPQVTTSLPPTHTHTPPGYSHHHHDTQPDETLDDLVQALQNVKIQSDPVEQPQANQYPSQQLTTQPDIQHALQQLFSQHQQQYNQNPSQPNTQQQQQQQQQPSQVSQPLQTITENNFQQNVSQQQQPVQQNTTSQQEYSQQNFSQQVNPSQQPMQYHNTQHHADQHPQTQTSINHPTSVHQQAPHQTHQANHQTQQANHQTHQVNHQTHQANNQTHQANQMHQANNQMHQANYQTHQPNHQQANYQTHQPNHQQANQTQQANHQMNQQNQSNHQRNFRSPERHAYETPPRMSPKSGQSHQHVYPPKLSPNSVTNNLNCLRPMVTNKDAEYHTMRGVTKEEMVRPRVLTAARSRTFSKQGVPHPGYDPHNPAVRVLNMDNTEVSPPRNQRERTE